MKITLVAGARPNFMKIAPIVHAIKKLNETENLGVEFRLIHTGQHYDAKLSDSFFVDLNIPQPDANLEVGSASHAVQTANIMIKFEQELIDNPTDLVLVVGDVNSTMACTIVAKKMNIKVAHVEAGLRSYDMEMPEEINRLVTDSIADYFFTTTQDAGLNLKKAGIAEKDIFFVGNTMIDTLAANLSKLEQPEIYKNENLSENKYIILTLHRPSNVDDKDKLKELLDFIASLSKGIKLIFPVHPRTRAKMEGLEIPSSLTLTEPMRYLEFIYLVKNAFCVVTDSGGIQEETTWLSVPCMTLRENTERPETVSIGTNELLGFNKPEIEKAFAKLLSDNWKKGQIPELWDGNTAERIVKQINNLFS